MAKKQKGNQFLVIAIAAILVIALVLFFRGGGVGEGGRARATTTGLDWTKYPAHTLLSAAALADIKAFTGLSTTSTVALGQAILDALDVAPSLSIPGMEPTMMNFPFSANGFTVLKFDQTMQYLPLGPIAIRNDGLDAFKVFVEMDGTHASSTVHPGGTFTISHNVEPVTIVVIIVGSLIVGSTAIPSTASSIAGMMDTEPCHWTEGGFLYKHKCSGSCAGGGECKAEFSTSVGLFGLRGTEPTSCTC